MKHKKKLLKDQRILLALVILLIVAVVSIINPRFIAVKNLITIFQQISVIGILTMAMSMLLIGGGIDLSIGNIMVLSGVVMARILGDGGNVLTAVAVGVMVGIACGLLNGAVIAKSKCIPLIITLGTSQVFYGLALTISGGRIMSFGGAFNAVGKTRLFDVFPVMLFVLIFMVVVSYVLMNRTRFGRRIVAIGGNEKNAFLSGIHVMKYKIFIYGIAGFFCSIAAIIFSARIDSITANAGAGYETSALTAAIIGGVTFDGGKGTISGAFLGCVLMGVISNAMNILQVETYIQTIITGGIIVSAVVLSNINNMKKK
ncbi:MAG: ABC transporter permease [Lachnospiraceae bacterium]|jgi:ribose/xylose/arabinose/galactoside ABC-type transport system permease subunit|nr:ABC transporter permease [Lachnospiraceae bacterium]